MSGLDPMQAVRGRHPQDHRHHGGDPHHTGHAPASSGAGHGHGGAERKLPFAWGSREYARPLFSIPFAAGALAAQQRVMKAGWIAKTSVRLISGSANVTAVGTAGTPLLQNMVQSYRLSFNGGFLYRSLDGDSLMMISEVETFGSTDPFTGSALFQNYTPTSATNQPIKFCLEDDISLNLGPNVDKFLLAAHARNSDIVLDITFGNAANVVANTETVALSGTLFFDGIFMLDPDYSHFSLPDVTNVQQWQSDVGYAGTVVVGDNVINITPIQGPEYLQLLFKVQLGGGPPPVLDPGGANPSTTRVQLLVNTGEPYLDVAGDLLAYRNQFFYGRLLPKGWYVLNFLDDIGLVNLVSSVARNVLATDYISTLQLIVTLQSGATITAGNQIKLLKRLKYRTGHAGAPHVGAINHRRKAA
jgi:hypothetical protein